MRDPELVFKAQLAASALERAWQRWRVIHGPVADPMPAISSYVGYSLEEPWGQPRVVFGMSAHDAEQLAALLNRHDCIGPVHAGFAGQQVWELPAGASRPFPVPAQAQAAVAEHADGGAGQPAGEAKRFVGPASESDGPVYRQVARAAREAARQAATAREAAGSGRLAEAPRAAREVAGSAREASGPVRVAAEAPGSGRAAKAPVTAHLPGTARAAGTAPAAAETGQAESSVAVSGPDQPGPDQPGPDQPGPDQPGAEPSDAGEAAESAASGQHAPSQAPAELTVRREADPGATQAEVSDRNAGRDQARSADPEDTSRRGQGDDSGGDDDGDEPGGDGPGGGLGAGRRAGRVIAVGGRSRGGSGGESRAHVAAPPTPGSAPTAVTSGSGVHSVADGSRQGAGTREAHEPGADAEDSGARTETGAAGARATVEAGSAVVAGPAGEAVAGVRCADAGSVAPIAAQAEDGPGPLALAASAARVATEARIRAATDRDQPSAIQGKNADAEVPAGGPGPAALSGGQCPAVLAGGPGPAVLSGGQRSVEAAARPEVASGARQVVPGDPAEPQREDNAELASTGGPESAADEELAAGDEFGEEDVAADGSDVVPVRSGCEEADDDAGQQPGVGDRPGHSPSGAARRNRITRGYSIPRISRAKRPGAVPGL